MSESADSYDRRAELRMEDVATHRLLALMIRIIPRLALAVPNKQQAAPLQCRRDGEVVYRLLRSPLNMTLPRICASDVVSYNCGLSRSAVR